MDCNCLHAMLLLSQSLCITVVIAGISVLFNIKGNQVVHVPSPNTIKY
jgi:hypothetical protein